MSKLFALSNQGQVQVLEVRDLISEYANRQILDAAQARIDDGYADFVVDLSQIDYMNSVGLNFLISLRNRSDDKGGQLAVANASSKIIQLLEMTKLRPLFNLTESIDDALASFA